MTTGPDSLDKGISTALKMLGVGATGDASPDNGQDELFEPVDMPMPVKPAPRSGPQGGRPRGARNRSTEQWRQWMLSRYRSPMEFLLEMQARSPADLAAELGLYVWNEGRMVTRPQVDEHGQQIIGPDGKPCWEPVLATGEAFKRQVEAAIACLPYLHQKQPLAIERRDGVQRGLLIVGDMKVEMTMQDTTGALVFADPPKVIDGTLQPDPPDEKQGDLL